MSPNNPEELKEKIKEILEFKSYVGKENTDCILETRSYTEEQDGQTSEIVTYIYNDEVTRFFQMLTEDFWYDPDYFTKSPDQLLEDEEGIGKANLDELKTLLTYCQQAERFCEGSWGTFVKKGILTTILNRLQAIQSSMET